MSTNGAFASYQEVIDLHTESDKVSVIGIHTPTNFVPHKMFGGFFKQFKKFKYNGCSVKLVPAARLPADPLQVSYEAGETTTIDPRDMLNPLMFHGCHGNDLGMILNKLYSINTVSGSDGIYLDNGVDMWQATQFDADGPLLESLYYKALTDNTWKKAHPQRGFRKAGLRPLVYQLATNVQFDGAHAWQSGGDYGEFFSESGMPIPSTDSNTGDVWDITSSVRDNMRVFTPKLTSLGWMDTYNVLTTGKFKQVDVSDAADADEANAMINEGLFDVLKSQESMATLPRIYMGVILLPPAYKTEQYFRMIVTHHFSFKQFRGISFSNDIMETPAYSNWNDVDNASEDSSVPSDPDTPGGGGDSPEPEPEPEPEPSGPTDVNLYYMNSYSIDGINYRFTTRVAYDIDGVEHGFQLSSTSTNNERYYLVAVNSDLSGFVVNTSTATKVEENKMLGLLVNLYGSGLWYIYVDGLWFRCDYDGTSIVTTEPLTFTPSYIVVQGGTVSDLLAFLDDTVYAEVTISDAKVVL